MSWYKGPNYCYFLRAPWGVRRLDNGPGIITALAYAWLLCYDGMLSNHSIWVEGELAHISSIDPAHSVPMVRSGSRKYFIIPQPSHIATP